MNVLPLFQKRGKNLNISFLNERYLCNRLYLSTAWDFLLILQLRCFLLLKVFFDFLLQYIE